MSKQPSFFWWRKSKERCENRSRPGVVAGQQCGLELGHHGPCFWTGEFSVDELNRLDAQQEKL